MKKLFEETDPRVPEGMARIAQKDADIAALKQQIAKLEDEKADIQTELAKIQGQSIDQGDQQQSDQSSQEELAQKVAAAVTAATSESLVERINEMRDDEDMIRKEMEELEDELAHLQLQEDPANDQKIQDIISELEHYADVLAQMERDQQEHEEDYWVDPAGGRHYDYGGDDDDDFYDPASMYESEDEEELEEKSDGPCWKGYEMVGMKEKGGKKVPNCVPESLDETYASPYRPKRDLIWKGKTYYISDVENVNDTMDIVYIDGKMMNSKRLEADGAEMVPKPKKERPKRMTKREYEKTLKDTMSSLKADIGEYDHSIVFDLAENLYYDPMVRDYIIRRWKKENGYTEWYNEHHEPKKFEIIELITNDLEMSESVKPTAKKNFRLAETYAEVVNKEEKKSVEEYIDEDFVFYVKVNDEGNEFIGKIFKVRPDGDWFGLVKKGKSDTFQKISYEPEYDEMDIIKFLGENYDEVEIIDRHEYNDFIEEDEEVEESWPMNTVGSSGPITQY